MQRAVPGQGLRDAARGRCASRPDGEVRSRWSPRHPDGRTFDVPGVWVAPDGRLWTTDGRSVFRLTDDGSWTECSASRRALSAWTTSPGSPSIRQDGCTR